MAAAALYIYTYYIGTYITNEYGLWRERNMIILFMFFENITNSRVQVLNIFAN